MNVKPLAERLIGAVSAPAAWAFGHVLELLRQRFDFFTVAPVFEGKILPLEFVIPIEIEPQLSGSLCDDAVLHRGARQAAKGTWGDRFQDCASVSLIIHLYFPLHPLREQAGVRLPAAQTGAAPARICLIITYFSDGRQVSATGSGPLSGRGSIQLVEAVHPLNKSAPDAAGESRIEGYSSLYSTRVAGADVITFYSPSFYVPFRPAWPRAPPPAPSA